MNRSRRGSKMWTRVGSRNHVLRRNPDPSPPVGGALRPFVGVLCPLVFIHVHHSATAKTLYIPGDRALDSVIWRLAAEGESSLLLATDAASCCSRPRPVSSVASSLLSSTCTSAPLLRPCAQLDPDPVHQHTTSAHSRRVWRCWSLEIRMTSRPNVWFDLSSVSRQTVWARSRRQNLSL